MLSVNDSVELLLLATAESPSSVVLSPVYSKESDLSISAQPGPFSRSTRSTYLQLHPVLGREDTVGSGRGRRRGSGSRPRHHSLSEPFK